MHKKSTYKVIMVWMSVMTLWSAYRYFFRTTPIWIEEILLKPIPYIGLVLWFFHDKGTMISDVLGFRTANIKKIIIWGGGFGTCIVGEAVFVWIFNGRTFMLPSSATSWILGLSIPLATAISEEILYRGFLMEQFWQKLENPWIANLISTLLFVIGHLAHGIFIFRYTGFEFFMYLWLMALLGYINGLIYEKTRSIYPTIFFHALWNFSNAVIT